MGATQTFALATFVPNFVAHATFILDSKDVQRRSQSIALLPATLLSHILHLLGPTGVARASAVSRSWRVCPVPWRALRLTRYTPNDCIMRRCVRAAVEDLCLYSWHGDPASMRFSLAFPRLKKLEISALVSNDGACAIASTLHELSHLSLSWVSLLRSEPLDAIARLPLSYLRLDVGSVKQAASLERFVSQLGAGCAAHLQVLVLNRSDCITNACVAALRPCAKLVRLHLAPCSLVTDLSRSPAWSDWRLS